MRSRLELLVDQGDGRGFVNGGELARHYASGYDWLRLLILRMVVEDHKSPTLSQTIYLSRLT
jgi:hypothetical protein